MAQPDLPDKITDDINSFSPNRHLQSRRKFLASAGAASALTIIGSSNSADGAGPDRRGLVQWNIDAIREEQLFGDGTSVPFFRYVSRNRVQRPVALGPTTPAAGRLPLLRAKSRQLVSLKVRNTLDFPIQPTIPGYKSGPIIPPNGFRSWRFAMPQVGTWMLTENLLGPVAGPVGFGAMLISEPRLATDLFGDYLIDREYVLLYQDADDRWNLAVDAGEQPDTSTYEPNYHLLNGLTFPHTANDADTRIACTEGDNVLLRMGNLGHVRHAVHLHGYHADIINRNNIPETMLPMKDTIPLPGHTTADLVLPVAQSGVFPMHPHSLTSTTDNGLYPFGQITVIDASQTK